MTQLKKGQPREEAQYRWGARPHRCLSLFLDGSFFCGLKCIIISCETPESEALALHPLAAYYRRREYGSR